MSNVFTAFLASVALVFCGVMLQLGFVRTLVKRFGPAPGTGPSKEERDASHFRYSLAARIADSDEVMHGAVTGKDPGYGETAKMLAESALCLAFDDDQLMPNYGVITPAFAMGDSLIKRLNQRGLLFDVC